MSVRKEVKSIDGKDYLFSLPTIGSGIAQKTIIIQRTRGTLGFLESSVDEETQKQVELLKAGAYLEANVSKLKDAKTQEVDYEFSFFDLDESESAHILKVNKEFTEWVATFRKVSTAGDK